MCSGSLGYEGIKVVPDTDPRSTLTTRAASLRRSPHYLGKTKEDSRMDSLATAMHQTGTSAGIVTFVTAIIGMVFGTVGAILGTLAYLRDRPRVVVTLQWDMAASPGAVDYLALKGAPKDPKKLWGVVGVTNTGRRPVFISHVHLGLPKGSPTQNLLLVEGIQGNKLGEGDPPKTFIVDQEQLPAAVNLKKWREVRGQVRDSAGKLYRSRRAKEKTPPSWIPGPKK